jgi:hypothetical protein
VLIIAQIGGERPSIDQVKNKLPCFHRCGLISFVLLIVSSEPVPTSISAAQRCALLVVSCDPYADLWQPFFTLLGRHWPDCPFPLYLGCGPKGPTVNGVTMLRSEGARDWSRCLADYLDAIEQPYVLVILDDFFLRRPVSTPNVLHCLDFAESRNATQVRLIPRPGPTDPVLGDSMIGACAPGSPYRLSTQAAIWNRQKLRRLIRPGESIWQFEREGNVRAGAELEGFFAARKPVLPYADFWAHHVIEKGKWLPHERSHFGRMDVGCDFEARETLPWRRTFFYQLVQNLDRLLSLLPWKLNAKSKRAIKAIFGPMMRRSLDKLGTPPSR